MTCTAAGAWHAARFLSQTGRDGVLPIAAGALAFSAGLLGTLAVHEWSHYRHAMLYRVRCSLPFFIPAPTLAGTFGAGIRMKERPRDRYALFDIAAAGPIAGLAVCIPATIIAMLLCEIVPIDTRNAALAWQWSEGTLAGALRQVLTGSIGEGQTVALHPLAVAKNISLFIITSINLLPIGPLDGGHITRALVGYQRRVWQIGIAVATMMVLAGFASPTWRPWGAAAILIQLLGKGMQVHPNRSTKGWTANGT